VEALKAITEDLPPAHRDVLQFIIFHLARFDLPSLQPRTEY